MYFIDVQGTLIDDADRRLINGALELIQFLNLKQIPYVIVTNNTKKQSSEFIRDLGDLGLNIKTNGYIDPFCVLDKVISPCDCAIFGSDEFKQTLQNLGYKDNLINPKAVLLASYDDFKFIDFAAMNEFILNGARLVAMHETSLYKKNGRIYPGVGAIARMLSYSTSAKFSVVSKPSVEFYNEALRLINLQKNHIKFEDITIISDDAKGDLEGAKKLGMQTALVLSGKISSADKSGVGAGVVDKIYKDVKEFLKTLYAR